MQTANSPVNYSSASDIIGALQNILAHSQVLMSDLKTPYSQDNHIPTASQPAFELKGEYISNIVAQRQQQLDTILLDISGLETVMADTRNLYLQLVEQKDKITQSMNFHKGLVSSLWLLPSEILSQIFHLCLPEDKYLSPASNQATMLLTKICRPWREVAMGMPSLWCRLAVDRDNRDWEEAVVFYDSWLKRARGYPLKLALMCRNSSQQRRLLQPYIDQISSLTIYVDHGSRNPEDLLKDLPALKELDVQASEISSTMKKSISRLPSTMRSLDIRELPDFQIVHLSHFNPLWVHLTNIKIKILHLDAFLHLLRLCPNLSSLTAHTSFYEMQTLKPLTHANIQSLSIVHHNSWHIGLLTVLFNALSLPNLRILGLWEEGYVWPHEGLQALLARSACPLESLIFSGQVMLTDVQRAEYIDLIPSLNVVVARSGSDYFP